ncbi:hypothetical protein CCHL11_06613 [Colletotrichum chlorophyti]|uniref:Rhodopsin domain-containing protein n=1 Tax=Colletotrichum chlorophyti TaxID=708187 RepID=A0A1Q8RXK3_9PEZI|nr:hypothetical protein CCHL11_06613 [Colletotrichum chlorophyti]
MSGTPGTAAAPLDPEWAAESNTARIMAIVTIFHVLALIFVVLRIYARVRVIKAPGWDDWVIVLSAICALGGWTVFVIQAHYGLGKHYITIEKSDLVVFSHAGFWQSVISAAGALMWLKVSIALNLLRLSPSKWYKWTLWATIVLTFIYCIGGMFPFFLHCKPMAGFWNKNTEPPPKCMGIKTFIMFAIINTGFNIFTDIVLATLPIPIIWNLHMKRKVRLYVIGILSLGYFAVAMGVVKAIYQLAYGTDPDKTFNQSVQFWGFLQLQLGIIAACAPTLRPLVSKMLNLSSNDGYTHDTYGSRSRQKETDVRATKRSTMRSHLGPQGGKDEYELDEQGLRPDDSDRSLNNGKGETTATASFYKQHSGYEMGSEEMILPGGRPVNFKGIIRTTEVTVK